MKSKKLISMLLVLTMMFSYVPLGQLSKINLDIKANAAEGVQTGICGDNLTWSLDTNTGELVISGTGNMTDYSSHFAPWYDYYSSVKTVIVENGVNSIGDFAFSGCEELTGVTIGNSVTSIGNEAFSECTSLSNIIIPDSVTAIGSYVFEKCTSLTSVQIGNGLTSTGNYTFSGCAALTSIAIPESVMTIGFYSFENCTALTSITIPDSVTCIDACAFLGCTKLTNITIPDSVTSIKYYAFYSTAYYNDKSNWVNEVLYIGNHLIEARTTKSGVYEIKSGTKTIADKAFYKCTNLINIIIPDSVINIGMNSFNNCTALEYVHIPASVTSIGDYAFHYTNAYICSTTEDCYAKTYAVENDITFKVCTGNNGEAPETNELKTGTDADTNISYYYENGCFKFNGEEYEGEVDFEVIIKDKADYEDAFRGYADESDDIFFYKIKFYAVDESGNRKGEIQPFNNKKVKISFPIPSGYENNAENSFMILHKRSDNGKLDFFISSKNNIEVKNGYMNIWTDNFSPFALVVNYNENTSIVSSISIESLPSKTSYTYKSDNLDLSGFALTATYSDGTTETITDTSKMKVSGFDNKKVGTQTVTVEYEDTTATFDVTVSYAWWQWIIRILLLGFLWY